MALRFLKINVEFKKIALKLISTPNLKVYFIYICILLLFLLFIMVSNSEMHFQG